MNTLKAFFIAITELSRVAAVALQYWIAQQAKKNSPEAWSEQTKKDFNDALARSDYAAINAIMERLRGYSAADNNHAG